jgi:hypothetical protein
MCRRKSQPQRDVHSARGCRFVSSLRPPLLLLTTADQSSQLRRAGLREQCLKRQRANQLTREGGSLIISRLYFSPITNHFSLVLQRAVSSVVERLVYTQ